MKKVVYLNNFMTLDLADIRNNRNTYSQPGNNKITGILDALLAAECDVTMISNGLVNKRSGKFFRRIESKFHGATVIYCSILDLPILNTLSSILSVCKEMKRLSDNDRIDNVIFYNYKPEVAFPALYAKKFLKIPITIEFEDGFTTISYLGKLKRIVMGFTERFVSKRVDSAIVVNSMVAKRYAIPTVVVRGIVNKDFYNECNTYKKERNKQFTILYSGGLNQARGIYVLLEALKYTHIDFTLFICGKGEIEHIDDPRVVFKGFVTIEEAHFLMKQADLLVITQLKNNEFGNESFPSKLFEYVATGNMIISSNVGDVQQFAGDSIVYYDNDDPKELADRINDAYVSWHNGEGKPPRVMELCLNNMPEKIGESIVQVLK